jgi:hypothetical protein
VPMDTCLLTSVSEEAMSGLTRRSLPGSRGRAGAAAAGPFQGAARRYDPRRRSGAGSRPIRLRPARSDPLTCATARSGCTCRRASPTDRSPRVAS